MSSTAQSPAATLLASRSWCSKQMGIKRLTVHAQLLTRDPAR